MSEEPSIYSVVVADDVARMLTWLSADRGISQEECLKAAIAIHYYLRKQTKKGAKILVQKQDGDIREVFFG